MVHNAAHGVHKRKMPASFYIYTHATEGKFISEKINLYRVLHAVDVVFMDVIFVASAVS